MCRPDFDKTPAPAARLVGPPEQACNNVFLVNNVRGCRGIQACVCSPAIVQILEYMMMACSSSQTSWPRRRSPTDRLLPVSRPNEAEFPPAAQTALELLDWTFRGPRAVDRASCDALRPQDNGFKTEDYYEISIPREKRATTASRWIPTAVRYARRSRAVEGSRKKELLAEDHGLLRRRR
jgi:hypothetical protein